MFSIFAGILGLMKQPDEFGLSYVSILLIGVLGSILLYFLSKPYMGWSLGLKPLDVESNDKLDEINHHVKRLALSATVRPPELYYFENDKPNVLLLGTNPNKLALAFSSSMLEKFSPIEIAGAMATLFASSKNKTLKTKTMLIALMNVFGLGIGQWIYDKLSKNNMNLMGKIIYNIIFIITLLIFNLPTYIIFRIYSRKSTFKNDLMALEITSGQEIISGLSRIGSNKCEVGIVSKYLSFVGKQNIKDNFLNPFSTIPIRIENLVKEFNKRNFSR